MFVHIQQMIPKKCFKIYENPKLHFSFRAILYFFGNYECHGLFRHILMYINLIFNMRIELYNCLYSQLIFSLYIIDIVMSKTIIICFASTLWENTHI